jgi:hypothetical protein
LELDEPEEEESGSVWDLFVVWFFVCVVFFGFLVLVFGGLGVLGVP